MADMTQSKVAVVNSALNKLGQGASSFTLDTTTDLGGSAALAWKSAEAEAIAQYDWSFARRTLPTTLQAAAPLNGWAYGFDLPGNRVGDPVAVLSDVVRETYHREFMIEAGCLYANVKPLWVRVRGLVDPQYWDEGFTEAFTSLLAAHLAVPLLQDTDLEQMRRQDALGTPQQAGTGGLFGKLIAINKAAQPQGRRFMDNDPLTSARFG